MLHDIPGDRGNVDHVVICGRGIFVIEPKNWTQPAGRWELEFDGERIHIPGRAPAAAASIQCRAQGDEIRALLQASTSKVFPVRGIVVFLDWFVHWTGRSRGADIWVLNPKRLEGRILQEQPTLSTDEVAMATLHLKQYVKRLAA